MQKEYTLTVIAADRAVKSKFAETPSYAEVLMQVRRVNRNAPFIAVHSLPSLFAHSHPDTLASVTCSDIDKGIHGQIDSLLVAEESSLNLNKSITGNKSPST